MNDITFSNSFIFHTITFDKFHHTDNRAGISVHFFAYMLCGKCKITTETKTVNINEGDIFYIPNKCSYQSYWYGTPEIKFISLGFPFMPNFDNKHYPVQVLPGNDKAIEIFNLLSNKNVLSPKDIGIFYTLVGILSPLMTNINLSRTQEIVEHTKEYLIQHPFAGVSDLAENCLISESALYSAFKKSSNITINQLKNNLLLEKAKDMLLSTDKSINYISNTLCFSSTSYFRKKFKQYFNITPKEMRKKYKI